MKEVLVVYTWNTDPNSFGGIKTIIESYIEKEGVFETNGYTLNYFNYKPELVGKYGPWGHVLYAIKQIIALKKYLKKTRFDIVHIHTSRDFLFFKDMFIARMVKRTFNIPVVITVHVGAAETVFKKIGLFKGLLTSLHNKYVNKTLFLSKSIQRDFVKQGFHENRTGVLYNFHNLVPVLTSSVTEKEKGLRLIYVGAIHREKGILDLLTAINDIKDFPCHLDICGTLKDDGIKPIFERKIQQLRGYVTCHGMVRGEEKTRLYEKADLLILPSYHEGFPMVILEALQSKCAIISTQVGATPEILNEENAYWVAIKSPEQIKEAILFFYNNRGILEEMKENNYKMSNYYSLDNHIKQLCGIYNNV